MFSMFKLKKESADFLENVTFDKKPQEICKYRTEDCLNWYSDKAIFYKYFFYILTLINVAAPLVSSLIIIHIEKNWQASIITTMASFSASLLALFNVRDKWTMYRDAAEFIKSEYTLYCSRTIPYDSNEDKDNHSLYLRNIEKYMNDVHLKWQTVQKHSAQSESLSNDDT